MTLTIEPLHIPESVDAPDAGDWLAYVDIVNEMCRADAGSDLFDGDAATWLVGIRNRAYRDAHTVVARDAAGTIVGIGNATWERDGATTANVDVAVRPSQRGTGIEDAIQRSLEAELRARGLRIAWSYAFVRGDGLDGLAEHELLRPSSGRGAVPRDDVSARFMLRHGYELGQVERASTFDLRADPSTLERTLEAALQVAGAGYEPLWWQTPTPDEHVDGYAAAVARMSTDVPSGDLAVDETAWDAARIRHRAEAKASAGVTMAVAAVRHRPSGRIVAFNEIQVVADRTRPSENIGTLVLSEHRGRRLGTIVKCLGLLRWRELVPSSPVVQTFNAEENAPMLAVNEAVGFAPACWTGEWQKRLA
ncbi:GNAT family N-acetyltransferase [Microbacterium karelineae]|uniref:GNAT family N-acetyltransferase n=1 Tax=Microbacterium karelineae TaxID=2654283 RepID=UPI0012EAFD4C|nr:GNAT family N-acetyltransferase [Microbacterium karelineae]